MKTSVSQPRNASTVILVRDGEEALQVYLLRRNPRSDFMPGNYVFPGGILEPEDADPDLLQEHVDLDRTEAARHLGGGLAVEQALAFGVAAIRETFEEAGILFAHRGGKAPGDVPRIRQASQNASQNRGWFRDLVREEGWTLELSTLRRWAHWLTPEALRLRYDTRFFVAPAPSAQQCTPDHRETIHGIWMAPGEALSRNHRGEITLSPPTLVTLHELLPYQDTRRLFLALEGRQWGKRRLPKQISFPRGHILLLPWDPLYGHDIDGEALWKDREFLPLPPGNAFSRLWHHDGIWRPAPCVESIGA